MRCPNCGHENTDPEGLFCSRCGTTLGEGESEATTELDADTVAETVAATSSTTELRSPVGETGPEPEPEGATGPPPPPPPSVIDEPPPPPPPVEREPEPVAAAPAKRSFVRDLFGTIGARLTSSWLDVTAAACLAFLVLLCIGGVLLLGAKLQYPALGVGANAIEVLTGLAIVALAILRAPIHLGNVTVTVLPLGALAAVALGTLWSARAAIRDRGTESRAALRGVRIAIPFALICWVASLSFRFRGREEIFAGAWGTLFWALVWGALFGAAAGVLGDAPLWSTIRAKVLPERPEGATRVGISAGVVMLASAAVLSAFALLLWVIVGLMRGTPIRDFGAGDALAAVVYLIAFAPNILGIITALGMGSALDVGARVTIARSPVGRFEEISMFSWGGDAAPVYVFLLLAVPLVATVAGGFYARRKGAGAPMLPTIAWAAASFAVVLFLIALLGDARLGGGLAGRGVAHISVHAFRTLLLALLWGAAGGTLGWRLAARARSSPKGAG
ncbi:MAG: hypothetical protein ACRDKT_10345 [Actinomycetota bacterium]